MVKSLFPGPFPAIAYLEIFAFFFTGNFFALDLFCLAFFFLDASVEGVEPKIGGTPPKWMVYFMETLLKWMIWGAKTPMFGPTPIWYDAICFPSQHSQGPGVTFTKVFVQPNHIQLGIRSDPAYKWLGPARFSWPQGPHFYRQKGSHLRFWLRLSLVKQQPGDVLDD